MKNLREVDLTIKQSLLVVVSAKDAEWALEKVEGNRRLANRVVNRYRAIMEDGNWQDDHPDPIIFDERGRLMNGQHRLSALAQAGDRQYLMTVRTMEPHESIMSIDTGHKRLAVDQIKMYAGLSVPSSLIAAVRYWDCEKNTIVSQAQMSRGLVSPQRFLAIMEEYPVELGMVSQFFVTNVVGITSGAVGCAMLVGAKACPVHTNEFMAQLKNPASTIPQAAMLKTWLMNSTRTTKGPDNTQSRTTVKFEHALYALQAYIDGRTFTRWPSTYPRTIERPSNG